MINDCPFLFAEFQWLSALDFSILEHLEFNRSILVNNSRRLKLLTIYFGHLTVNLDTPLLESFVILEHGDHSANSFESLLCGNKFILLEFSHLSLILCKVDWQTSLVATLSWEINLLILSISNLVNE